MFDRFLFSRHLEEDETVSRYVHAHWLIGIKYLLLPTVSFGLSVLVLSARPTAFFFYGTALWAVLSLVWWARNFCDYYLDVWIVTDHGIVAIEWMGLFHRQSTRILYSDVEGVSYEIHGLAGTIFRYGTLSVEKVSTGSSVTFPDVPRPKSVVSVILRNVEEYVHSKNLKNAKQVQEILSEFVSREIHSRSIKAEPAHDPQE